MAIDVGSAYGRVTADSKSELSLPLLWTNKHYLSHRVARHRIYVTIAGGGVSGRTSGFGATGFGGLIRVRR